MGDIQALLVKPLFIGDLKLIFPKSNDASPDVMLWYQQWRPSCCLSVPGTWGHHPSFCSQRNPQIYLIAS